MLLHTRGHPTCVEVSYDYSNEYAYPYFYIGQLKGQEAYPCATRRTSIYKGLATLPYKCSRNCQ